MNQNYVNVATFISSAIVAGLAVKKVLSVQKEEHAKREEIDKNMRLDIAAIRRVAPILEQCIDNGQILNLEQLKDAFDTEVAFQKIAIREE